MPPAVTQQRGECGRGVVSRRAPIACRQVAWPKANTARPEPHRAHGAQRATASRPSTAGSGRCRRQQRVCGIPYQHARGPRGAVLVLRTVLVGPLGDNAVEVGAQAGQHVADHGQRLAPGPGDLVQVVVGAPAGAGVSGAGRVCPAGARPHGGCGAARRAATVARARGARPGAPPARRRRRGPWRGGGPRAEGGAAGPRAPRSPHLVSIQSASRSAAAVHTAAATSQDTGSSPAAPSAGRGRPSPCRASTSLFTTSIMRRGSPGAYGRRGSGLCLAAPARSALSLCPEAADGWAGRGARINRRKLDCSRRAAIPLARWCGLDGRRCFSPSLAQR